MTNSDQKTILIVDDDPAVRRLLRRCFEMESYSVLEAENGTEMFQLLAEHSVDLITLDLSLKSEDGLDLAREVRRNSEVGIIMVTGRDDLVDTVVGLEVGADDYIKKPFEVREVLARVRTILRRTNQRTGEPGVPADSSPAAWIYQFDGWTLNSGKRELKNPAGEICELTTGEYDLLEVLVRHSQQVMTRDQIMDQMKGCDWTPSDRSIDNHIAHLRKKIGEFADQTPFIKTVRGVGYMFTRECLKQT